MGFRKLYGGTEGVGELILNGGYRIGSDEWDTGYCADCGDPLTFQERVDAILNLISHGNGYWCDTCTSRNYAELEYAA